MAATQDALASKFSAQLQQLQAIFPSWDVGDLAFTLQDTKGNVDEAAMMITEGEYRSSRASQFTQATRKKPVKSAKETSFSGKGHTNRNADSGGWEQVNGDGMESRGGRGGRGGVRGGRGTRGGRGGEPFRGGRGGRGGPRGGRGGYSGANGTANGVKRGADYPTSTATTTEGWASQVEQATSAAGDDAWASKAAGVGTQADDGGWGETKTAADAPEPSKGDDFSAAGGWGDAPAPKELEQAVKAGGTDWQEEIKKPVPVAKPTAPIMKPKMTWAQIAKPQEKPKPAPPPAPAPVVPQPEPEPNVEPETTSDEPVAQEAEIEPEALEETPAEALDAYGDAPEADELDAEAREISESEEPYANGHAEEVLPEEVPVPQTQEDEDEAWSVDPAIAGSGAQAPWERPTAAPVPIAPEPVTTYTGPPGFNTVVSKIQAQAAQPPRASSRAALRHQKADDQGVVLPPTLTSSASAMEMQFGSLSFGGLNGDGVEAPVVERPITPPPPPAPIAAPPVTSPIRAQPPAQPQVAPQPPAQPPTAQAPPLSLQQHPYYTQQLAQTQPPAQAPAQTAAAAPTPQAPAPAPPHPSYTSPHQTLQQQMQAYQAQQNQWQQQQQPAQHDSLSQHQQQQHQQQQQQQSQQPQHQHQYYRGGQDFYSAAQQGQPTPEPSQSGHQQQAHQSHVPPSNSPYDASFGAFGGSQHLFGQQAQSQQQHSEYGGQHRAYDSYAASGYPRPPVEESKQATPAPSHTPTASNQPQVPHQQSQYYSQMGYYQAPYNPYYQYGQAPNPGFQQYYPLAQQRNVYGQPAPQAPPAPIPQTTKQNPPTSQSPYGAPSSYPSSGTYDDQTFGGLGRFGAAGGENKSQSAQISSQPSAGLPSSYGSQAQGGQGLHSHGFLGMNNTPSATSATSRQQQATPDDGYKSAAGSLGQGGAAGRPQQQGQPGSQQGQGQQAYGGAGAGGYGAYGSYGGNQDWSQYGYGGRGNGYSHWQQ